MNINMYVREIHRMSEDGIAPTMRQWDKEKPIDLLSSTSIITKLGTSWRNFIRKQCNLQLRQHGPRKNGNICDCGKRATHFERVSVGTTTETLDLCDHCYSEFVQIETSYAPRPDHGAHNYWTG